MISFGGRGLQRPGRQSSSRPQTAKSTRVRVVSRGRGEPPRQRCQRADDRGCIDRGSRPSASLARLLLPASGERLSAVFVGGVTVRKRPSERATTQLARRSILVSCFLAAALVTGCIFPCNTDAPCSHADVNLAALSPQDAGKVRITVRRIGSQDSITCRWLIASTDGGRANDETGGWECLPRPDSEAFFSGTLFMLRFRDSLLDEGKYEVHAVGPAGEETVSVPRRMRAAGDECGCGSAVYDIPPDLLRRVGATPRQ